LIDDRIKESEQFSILSTTPITSGKRRATARVAAFAAHEGWSLALTLSKFVRGAPPIASTSENSEATPANFPPAAGSITYSSPRSIPMDRRAVFRLADTWPIPDTHRAAHRSE